jgi:hypothetical protein
MALSEGLAVNGDERNTEAGVLNLPAVAEMRRRRG